MHYPNGLTAPGATAKMKQRRAPVHEAARRIRAHRAWLLAAAVMPLSSHAAEKDWKTTVGSGNWTTASNWLQGVAPVAGDSPFILNSDATNRVVTYDYTGPAITLGSFRLDNTGTGTNTFMQSAGVLSYNSSNIGLNGRGTYIQSGGTVNATTDIDIGFAGGGVGVYNLSGGQVNTKDLFDGDQANGTFIQNGSGRVLITGTNATDGLYVGVSSAGVGSYMLDGGAVLNSVNNTYVGYAAKGTFTQNGGTHTIGNALFVGNLSASSGTYQMSGGVLTVFNDSEYIGFSGTGVFNQTGGTNTVVSGGLQLGANAGATGTYNLSNTANLSVSGSLTVGNAGTGVFNQTDTSQAILNAITVGNATGATGTYSLSGFSTLTTSYLTVGAEGSGVFNQTGGIHTDSGAFQIALFPGCTGSYNLGGSGSLAVPGVEGVGIFGPGTFNQSGGNNTTGGLNVGQNDKGLGTYNLSNSASLTVNGDEYVGLYGSGIFNQSGGNHTISGTLTISFNPVLSMKGSVFNLQGGTLSAPVINLNSGGTFNRTGGTLTFTNFNMSGGMVTGTLPNPGTFSYTNGTFAGRLINQGVLNLGPSFTAGNGIENDVAWTVNTGTSVVLNGAGLDNEGTLIIAGGTLVLSTSATNLNNGTLGFATSAPFHLNAALQNSGTINLNGSVWDGAGTLTNIAGGTITGYGTLGANFPLNSGTIVPIGGVLTIPAGFSNAGLIQGIPGGKLAAQNVINNGQLNQTAGTATMQALSGAGSTVVGGGGPAQVNVTSFAQSSITIGDQGSLLVSPNATGKFTNTASSLTITGSGQLNLANHDLLTNTPANTNQIRQYLVNGYAGGNWNGTGGINSSSAANDATKSRALGYADGADGIVAGLAAGQTLVRSTIYGDADLNGRVQAADFNLLSAHFNQRNATWDIGDFDYNGRVQAADFNLLSAHFNQRVTAGSPNAAMPAALTASPSVFAPVYLLVDRGTGDVELVAGPTSILSYDLESSDNNGNGDFIPSKWQKITQADSNNAFLSNILASNTFDLNQSGAPGVPYLLSGTYDLGRILPAGMSEAQYTADLSDPGGLINGPSTYGLPSGQTVPIPVFFVIVGPEPTGLGLAGLGAVGLLGRRRRVREAHRLQ